MRDEEIIVVRTISYFSSLTEEDSDDLFKGAYLQLLPKHIELATQGDPAEFLHIIVEGSVELSGIFNDRETTVFIQRPISTFNLSAVLNDSEYKMSARTLDKAKVLMIPAENVRHLVDGNHDFANAMVKELAKRYSLAISALKEQKLCSGVERLAIYLLREHSQTNGGDQIELTQEKRALAGLLGITPEYLSRAFNTLMDHGVEVQGNKIKLKNLDELNRLAGSGF